MAIYHITSIRIRGIEGVRLQWWYRFAGKDHREASLQMAALFKDKFTEAYGDAPKMSLRSDGIVNGAYTARLYMEQDPDPLLTFQVVTYDPNSDDAESARRRKRRKRALTPPQYNEKGNRCGINQGGRESQAMKTYEIYDVKSPFPLKLGGSNCRVRARNAKEAANRFGRTMYEQIVREKMVSNEGKGAMLPNEKITIVRHKYKVPHFSATTAVFGEYADFRVRADYGV